MGSESDEATQDSVQDRLPFSFVSQSCETELSAILALSLSNKVVYYKWICQLGLEPQSSGNLSTNLV